MAAGGTGGHLWPALSLALALKKMVPQAQFLFVGTGRPTEAKILDPEGFKRVTLPVSGLKGAGISGKLKASFQCLAGVRRALGIIRDFKPQLCFGAGGYVTVPVGLAAWLSRVPLVIHEQNSRAGLSNRILGKVAKLIMVGFEGAVAAFPPKRTLVTGNPVRPSIEALFEIERNFESPQTVLVTGGSQGASGLNEVVAPALAILHNFGLSFKVIHQAGSADVTKVRKIYSEAGLQAEVEEFFTDMPALYAQADLVIARAGAITLAELTAAGLPSILVPLPTAADDHQRLNALALEGAGAAVVLGQKGLNSEDLAVHLKDLLLSPKRLKDMSFSAKSMARLGADREMARKCLELIGYKGEKSG